MAPAAINTNIAYQVSFMKLNYIEMQIVLARQTTTYTPITHSDSGTQKGSGRVGGLPKIIATSCTQIMPRGCSINKYLFVRLLRLLLFCGSPAICTADGPDSGLQTLSSGGADAATHSGLPRSGYRRRGKLLRHAAKLWPNAGWLQDGCRMGARTADGLKAIVEGKAINTNRANIKFLLQSGYFV